MYKIRHLTREQYRVMPWKNHRGTTAEILIFPESASIIDDNYEWRVSSATIASSCSFSQFLGYDRIILLLDGDSMALNHDCVETPQVVRRLAPYCFKGEWQTTCEINDRAVQDFNVIVRRGKAVADLEVLPLKNEGAVREVSERHVLVFCVTGEIEVSGPGFTRKLGARESLFLEKATSDSASSSSERIQIRQIRTRSEAAEVILVRINPARSLPQG